jgi:hypothetical protein
VLRLWPESIHIGLFAKHCWLQRGGRDAKVHSYSSQGAGADALLRTLENMLDDRNQPLAPGSRLHLTVSDTVARVIALPWQEALQASEELQLYAQACFEQLGIRIDADWILRTEFRRFRTTGLAFALPRGWLLKAESLVAKRKLHLGGVLPVSAAAYYHHRPDKASERSVLLLREDHRCTALVYGRHRLLGHDMEPVTASPQLSEQRLLQRITADHGAAQALVCWSPVPPGEVTEPIPATDSGLRRLDVAREAWHR